MDAIEAIELEAPESTTLEYKSTDDHIDGILKEIVAFANNGGGTIVVGVKEEDGKIVEIQDVSDPAGFEEGLQQRLGSKVEPRTEIDFQVNRHSGKRIVEITVPSYDLLRSVDINKPTFPMRQGSTTTYLHGLNLARAYAGEGPNVTLHPPEDTDTEAKPTPKGFLKEIDVDSTPDQVLLLLYYLETYEEKDGVTLNELSDLLREARVRVPLELGDIIHRFEEDESVMEIDTDPTRWALTMSGINRAAKLQEVDSQERSTATADRSTEKTRSLAEYYRKADNLTKRDTALVVGWYLEYHEDQEDFTKAEVEQRAQDAKIRLGANVSRDLSNQVREGHLHKVGKRNGKDALQLTLTGEDYVEDQLLGISSAGSRF